MASMYGTIGTSTHVNLLADPQGVDKIAIPCEPGNGTLLQGQIMYRKATGLYAPAAATDVISTNSLCVLDEAVDTDADMAVAEDAAAYRAGRLLGEYLTLKQDGTLTSAMKLILRQQGIVLNVMQENDNTFENGRTAITYKANGGTGADKTAYADKGSTYAIAANAFTAPSSKTFSKWNTKADGTGTDYAAAASYTANADLVLFAIWA